MSVDGRCLVQITCSNELISRPEEVRQHHIHFMHMSASLNTDSMSLSVDIGNLC